MNMLSMKTESKQVSEPNSDVKGARVPPPARAKPIRVYLWLCFLISMVWLASTIWIMGGGFKHFEVDVYLPYHLSSAPLLSKLYDSRVFDADCYSARELSYLFDHIDCKVIAACMHAGLPHFMSTTTLFSVVILALAIWLFCIRDLRLGMPTTMSFTLLFLTTPFILFSSSYFRTGKISVSLLTVLSVITLFRFYHREQPLTPRRVVWTCLQLFVMATLAMLFDRQGVFLTGLAICAVILLAIGHSSQHRWYLALPFVLALVLNVLNSHIVTPHLTWAFHGYWPNLAFQEVPVGNILLKPWQYLLAGCGITVETMAFSFGNLPLVYFVVGWCCVVYSLWRMCPQGSANGPSFLVMVRSYSPLLLMMGVTVSIALLNILMVCRHTPLIWPDVRRFYYWLPTSSLWFMLAAILLKQIQQHGFVPHHLLTAALFILVMGNITALPAHRAVIRAGHLKKDMALGPQMLSALRPSSAVPQSIPPEVANDVVFRLFKNGENRFDVSSAVLTAYEDERRRIEVVEIATNRLQYAFAPIDGSPCAARGALVTSSVSLIKRSCLFGPMCLTSLGGKTYRFLPKPLSQSCGNQYYVRIRAVNKTASAIPFRLGSFVLASNNSSLELLAVGVDNWLFAERNDADRQGAQGQIVPIPGNGSREFVYAYADDGTFPTISMQVTK